MRMIDYAVLKHAQNMNPLGYGVLQSVKLMILLIKLPSSLATSMVLIKKESSHQG